MTFKYVCRVCSKPSDSRLCSDECDELNERLRQRNRNTAVIRSEAAPGPAPAETPQMEYAGDVIAMDQPEPCVLYGLLTAADVRELSRRRARFEAITAEVEEFDGGPGSALYALLTDEAVAERAVIVDDLDQFARTDPAEIPW